MMKVGRTWGATLMVLCGCAPQSTSREGKAPLAPSLGTAAPSPKSSAQRRSQAKRLVLRTSPDADTPQAAASSSNRASVGRVTRADYAIRIGIGFRPSELVVLERAAETWRQATGLPLHFRDGYGPMGNFHVAEQIPVCGQKWVYDGFLGCYHPNADIVVLNRFGIEEEQKGAPDLLYIVLLHEIGHWLGLGHVEDGTDSIMLPDYAKLVEREGEFTSLSERDVWEVCKTNPCDIRPMFDSSRSSPTK